MSTAIFKRMNWPSVHDEFLQYYISPENVAAIETLDFITRQARRDLSDCQQKLSWHERYFKIGRMDFDPFRFDGRRAMRYSIQLSVDHYLIEMLQRDKRGKEYLASIIDRAYDQLSRGFVLGDRESF